MARKEKKMNYRDCDYTVEVINELVLIDCFTKEQVKNNIRHKYGCKVYKMNHKDKKAILIGVIKPYDEKR